MLFRIIQIIFSTVLFYSIKIAAEKTITGKITHSGPNAIEKNAKVQIELHDTSLMDSASKLIASTTINDPKSFPISYTLKYKPSDVKAYKTYSISAKITGSNKTVLYANELHTPAELSGARPAVINIAVNPANASSESDSKKEEHKKKCKPVRCMSKKKKCKNGLQKRDGCEICKCNEPCNPSGKVAVCGPNEKCSVQKKPDGTFEANCTSMNTTKVSDTSKQQKNTTNPICNEPKSTGHCAGSLTRYFYNSATKSCEPFVYGGCRGNSNNFLTKASCDEACKA